MSLERANKQDSPYDVDSSGYLIYWDCISGTHPLLRPAERIRDPNLVISKVGQQNILPNHLTFKPGDFVETQVATEDGEPIGIPIPPGLSGFLFFGSQNSGGDLKDGADKIGKAVHSKSRLHIAQVRDIEAAGWGVFYTPLINNIYSKRHPTHVIMTPSSILMSRYKNQPTEQERETLAKVFVRWG
jgi:hypothetical protein